MYSALGFLGTVATIALTLTVDAQKHTPMNRGSGGSSHVRSEWMIDGTSITVEYGRPLLKGRSEADMMPPGKVWRTGADEQTTLTIDRPLKFGTLTVPPGRYGLHTVPGPQGWQLIVSKRSSGWGIPYPQGQDLGRVPMQLGNTVAPVEQLTIGIDDTDGGGTLRIEWGTVRVTLPFTAG